MPSFFIRKWGFGIRYNICCYKTDTADLSNWGYYHQSWFYWTRISNIRLLINHWYACVCVVHFIWNMSCIYKFSNKFRQFQRLQKHFKNQNLLNLPRHNISIIIKIINSLLRITSIIAIPLLDCKGDPPPNLHFITFLSGVPDLKFFLSSVQFVLPSCSLFNRFLDHLSESSLPTFSSICCHLFSGHVQHNSISSFCFV